MTIHRAASLERARTLAARAFGESVVLRRGATALAAQNCQIMNINGRSRRSDESTLAVATPELHGSSQMDVAEGDRFTLDGTVYEVIFVRPERITQTIADIEARH